MNTPAYRSDQSVRLLVACFLFCSLLAQTSLASSLPAQSPEKIVKQYLKAVGGEKAVKRITSWRVKGTVTRASDGAKGAYEVAAMRPDLYFEAIELRGFESSEGFNGKSAWRRDSRESLHTLTGAENSDFRAEASYRSDRLVNYKKKKLRVSSGGTENAGGKQAHIVFLTNSRNVKIKMAFDASSGLLIKEEIPAGGSKKVFEYADYRSVDGVLQPHHITLSDGQEKLEIALDRIEFNRVTDRSLFDFPRISQEPLPDIPTLLKEVSDHQEQIDRLREKYTFTEEVTHREFDKNGVVKERESETSEIIFYRGRAIRKHIAKNGKPLSPDEIASQDRQIEKAINEIDKQEAKKAKKEQEARAKGKDDVDDDDENRVRIADVLRTSQLVNPRRERFRQRDVIVFDFEPKPGYKPKKPVEKLMQKMAGAVWVDADAKQIARIEARLIDSYKIGGGLLASIKSGAVFVIEQERLNDEVWLPSYSEFNLGARLFLFVGMTLNQTVKYSDYKRFSTEAGGEVKAPIKPDQPDAPVPLDGTAPGFSWRLRNGTAKTNGV